MKMTLVVEELKVPTRNIHASVSVLPVREGDGKDEGIGAHCENVMTGNHGREWHTNNGGGTALAGGVRNKSKNDK